MILPFKREHLDERARLDADEDVDLSMRESPSQRLATAVALSDLVRTLATGAGARWIREDPDDLAEKAARYATRQVARLR
jgi:hypothetical protein